jgi:hypothetical protein
MNTDISWITNTEADIDMILFRVGYNLFCSVNYLPDNQLSISTFCELAYLTPLAASTFVYLIARFILSESLSPSVFG